MKWQSLDSSSRLSDPSAASFHHGHGGPYYEQRAARSKKPKTTLRGIGRPPDNVTGTPVSLPWDFRPMRNGDNSV